MKVSKTEIKKDIEDKKSKYDQSQENLDKDKVVEDALPFTYGLMGKTQQSIGLDRLLLGEKDAHSSFSKSAENFMTKIDRINKLGDKIEGSHRAHQPYNTQNVVYSAILSDDEDIIQRAIGYGDDLEEDYLDKYTDFIHLYLYVKALNEYLKGEENEAEKLLDRLGALDLDDDYAEYYRSLSKGLRGIINRNESEFLKGLNDLLKRHDTYNELSTASDFVSIDAIVYLKLAEKKEGLDFNKSKIDEDLLDYIPETVFD